MIFASMFFSRGVLNGEKELFQNEVSTVGAKSEVAHKWEN